MSLMAINALRTSVAKLHPLAPLSGLELAVERGVLTVVKENADFEIGIASNFPADCTSSDVLDAIDHGAHHLAQALQYVEQIFATPRRVAMREAFSAGFDAIEAFMDIVTAARDKNLPLNAAE
ncbi:hypothetical protein [Shinella pollutisoli]|uniref:Uncharacterized protein n=1 Tax=Shinella pollutisoli TaxID=2250594 RepID=A0ABV7DIG0_9HYPH|nr:hypothetical protein [Shinella pollutisoli]